MRLEYDVTEEIPDGLGKEQRFHTISLRILYELHPRVKREM